MRQRLRSEPSLSARVFLRSTQVKRHGSEIWSHGPVHSEPQGETAPQAEALRGPAEMRAKLCALTHLCPCVCPFMNMCVHAPQTHRHRTLF